MDTNTFLARVNRSDGCWRFNDRRSGSYQQVVVDGKPWMAHRLMCTLFNGPIPEGYVVLHLCDHPWCINPAHLRAGTQSENMQDCYAKGRGFKGLYRRWDIKRAPAELLAT